MKRMSKWLARVCIAVVLLGTLGTVPAKAAEEPEPGIKVEVPENKVLTYKYREAQDLVITVTNTGDVDLKNIRVSPKLKQGNEWPFKREYQSYEETLPSLAKGESGSVSFKLTQRDDAGDKSYLLVFGITAENESGQKVVTGEESFFVNTSAKPQESQEEKKDPDSAGGQESASQMAAGSFDNGEAVYSGGGSSGNGSVPRVIVTGFTTNPAEVKAGSDFTLTIHLKNTSKSTRVSNMLFELQAPTEGNDAQTSAPAFLPTAGSNSIYLDGIGANGTTDISMQLNAKADLVQKPYEINLSMKYEDSQAAQIEAEASLSIPVKQEARFEFSEFEITPESIQVGEEANVTCNLYNLGRIKLYNAKAIFEGDCIEKEEVFLGNLEPGSSTAIDAMLEGKKASQEEGKIKMTLSYEDEGGSVSTAEESFNLLVEEASDDDAMMEMMPEEGISTGLPILPIVIAVLVVAGIAAVIIVKKKKKARGLLEEEEELLDELDGSSEDERQ